METLAILATAYGALCIAFGFIWGKKEATK
jgi:hypothetical protein